MNATDEKNHTTKPGNPGRYLKLRSWGVTVVADALSRKSHVNTLMTEELPKELAEDLRELCLMIVPRGYVATLEIQSNLMDKIREA